MWAAAGLWCQVSKAALPNPGRSALSQHCQALRYAGLVVYFVAAASSNPAHVLIPFTLCVVGLLMPQASSLEELVSWNELFQQAAASVRRLESSNNTTLGFNTLLTPVVSARSDAESVACVNASGKAVGDTASAAKDEPDQGEVTPGGVPGRNLPPAADTSFASPAHGKKLPATEDDGGGSVPNLDAQGTSPFPTLAALARDFVYTASNYGRILIEEMNLPHHLKTLKPKEADGIGGAGGAKFVFACAASVAGTSAASCCFDCY